VTAIASLVLSFRHGGTGQQLSKAGILVGGLLVLWLLSRTGPVDRALTHVISRILRARGYDVRDFDTLLALRGNHTVAELRVREDDWIANRTLRDLRVRDEGVVVMGIQRGGAGYIGAPGAMSWCVPATRWSCTGGRIGSPSLTAGRVASSGTVRTRRPVSGSVLFGQPSRVPSRCWHSSATD
jgi:hypothetical protein